MSTIFRKVSLDRLASPEQLDQLMHITDPKGWITLLGAGIVIATAVVWGFLGRVPENVTGTGMLVKSGGICEVVPVVGGRIIDIAVAVGDVAREGQVVARMAQPDLGERIVQAKAALEDLRERHAQLVANGNRDLALQATNFAQQRAALEQIIGAAGQSLVWYREKLGIQERLVQEGLLVRDTYLNTRQQHQAARERIDGARNQLTQLAVKELELRTHHQQQVRQSQVEIDEQERSLRELERQYRSGTELLAPQTGHVLEIMAERGAIVAPGTPILSLDLVGRSVKDLEAVVYVPSIYGKQVRVGMPILIAPSTVRQEEYGFMLGKVTHVSDFPATSRGMLRVLKNDKLVTALSGQDAPYEVNADLVLDPETTSQYRWSSSKGPSLRIQSGTLAMAKITVGQRRPVEMILPLLRRHTGL